MQSDFTEFEEVEACPVCGAPKPFRPVESYLCQCPACAVYFCNPRPTQRQIAASYNVGANYNIWASLDPKQRKVMWETRLRLLGGAGSGRRLLDVGVGDGYFLHLAREHGYKVQGTELSVDGAQRAQSLGFEIAVGQFTDLDFTGQQFDVITLWHVLEHVPNPGEVLDRARLLLRPGGQLAIAVPNEDNNFVNHRLGRRGSQPPIGKPEWTREIHLTYFQPATLKRSLQARGFRLVAFGVDELYTEQTWRNRLVHLAHKGLSSLTGWHFSRAMFTLCQKPLPLAQAA